MDSTASLLESRTDVDVFSDVVQRGNIVMSTSHRAQLPSLTCPVCRSAFTDSLLVTRERDYWQCAQCWAVFVDPAQRPTPDIEASHYTTHDNQVDEPRCRTLLADLANPLLDRVPVGSHGLDYCCGPTPVLAHMLREAGRRMTVYDPLFYPNDVALEASYDFITMSEVAEHLHDPAAEFARLFASLRPGGVLALMTSFAPAATGFERWHYRHDPTHVVFYRPSTLRWLARRHGAGCEIPCPNVALLTRRG